MHEKPSSKDAPVPATEAGVSFVMPVLNEEDYLERAVRSVLAQDVPGPMEFVIALGPSTDSTDEIARRLAAEDPRVRLVANPEADIPCGLNHAIRASIHPTIVRVDAHSELTPGYVRRALETLARTRAASVGGIMRAEGHSAFQRAVARAYNSPIGLGGASYHGGTHEGDAESAYLGVMRREVLEEIGLYDESIRRGEDWDLNFRIRQAGYRVWFDPQLLVTYWPRDSWTRLVRQFVATGAWRGELVRRYGRRNSLRFFAPPALVATAGLAVLVGALQGTRALRGAAAAAASLVYAPLALYLVVVSFSAAGRGGGPGLQDKLWTAAVLPTIHLAWGVGFIRGALVGAKDTVDTSRVSADDRPA
ncbi:glycosyl transferase family 2 [Microbacterium mangrovi]|uniref:Glycosyl transferase family 2 n=1 Tax=Microbacterium mangrovi TaxID=1348253 RepID=A0A0B2A2W9_9MICO|nr:glycosyltransferase family 2 protein [Microbacterium mangrovi]KHK97385.1 glycosyl transferase family 2 [Microbacterium mangrovi]